MLAKTIIECAASFIGCNEYDGSHRDIIDTYNSHKPLARSYKVQYTDSWCATFVSAISILCGATDIIPTECGCEKQIALFKALNCWEESKDYTPCPGDIIYYDWDKTDTWADHVGIVENVSGKEITVIEGNYNDSVGRRTVTVGDDRIRGYGLPNYEKEKAMKYYELIDDMNFRVTPNGSKICAIKKGTVIHGEETKAVNGITWLKTEYNGQTGYVAILPESKKYAIDVTYKYADSNILYLEALDTIESLKSEIASLKETLAKIVALASK